MVLLKKYQQKTEMAIRLSAQFSSFRSQDGNATQLSETISPPSLIITNQMACCSHVNSAKL